MFLTLAGIYFSLDIFIAVPIQSTNPACTNLLPVGAVIQLKINQGRASRWAGRQRTS